METDRVIGVILGGGRGMRLQPLTKLRAKPAVPIAGKFRLIDIPISNCINSGIKKIYILTQFNTSSLHRHIHQSYHFDTFTRGFIEVLGAQQTLTNENWYQGTADAVRQQLPNLRAQDSEYFLILAGDHLYQMDYRDFIHSHRESCADITVAVQPVPAETAHNYGILKMDENGRITDFSEKPPQDKLAGLESATRDPARPYLASMGIYVFNRGLLVRLLAGDSGHDFGRHIIPDAIRQMHVHAYEFTGYWEDIGTITAFFNANLALTDPMPAFDIYQREKPIYTRPRYLPASKVDGCTLHHSIICEGCIIESCIIERTIVGIRSRIMPGVRLSNVIMMGADFYQTTEEIELDERAGSPIIGIGRDSVLRNAIVDKNARIGAGVRLVNEEGVQEGVFSGFEVRDGIIVVTKNSIIRDGTIF